MFTHSHIANKWQDGDFFWLKWQSWVPDNKTRTQVSHEKEQGNRLGGETVWHRWQLSMELQRGGRQDREGSIHSGKNEKGPASYPLIRQVRDWWSAWEGGWLLGPGLSDAGTQIPKFTLKAHWTQDNYIVEGQISVSFQNT